jgi:uncharacterized Zn-binding protein involved in type VI secretion
MSAPAIVQGDRVTGVCPNHLTGSPQVPAGPMPFSAPLTLGLVPTVLIGGKPAAVVGSSGYNTPPHAAPPLTDAWVVPTMQQGRVLSGSPTVLFGGKPAANAQSSCLCCATPGQLMPTVPTVVIG